ncbi:MAG: hypothetical protein R3182_03725, partial [Draconibacterium sp.]|nr:hypothetical protein [Draconibacterium sp.]
DKISLKVSKRALPKSIHGIRIFVLDNKNVKALTSDKKVHGLLQKDVLICLSSTTNFLLDQNKYVFPVSYNDGFLWSTEEDSHIFSYMGLDKTRGEKFYRSYEGLGVDLNDARGIEKHWIVAFENSTVVWVKDKNIGKMDKEACVLLQSDANPGIYYIYNHLYNKNTEVKKGQKLIRGEIIGTAWGDDDWGHLQLVIVKSDSVPTYENKFHNAINFFPQFYELYYKQTFSLTKSFTRGRIEFGKNSASSGNKKNIQSFEEYSGKGWMFDKWNKADKVEWIAKGLIGNARLKKVLFSGSPAASRNPKNYFEYQINVNNGVYRIRAEVGDVTSTSWQKIEFEGIHASTYTCKPGEYKWTSEKVVKVHDRKLTVRIYLDEENNRVAGLSQLVFQRAY